MPLKTDKTTKLYYSIGEVAEMFSVNETLLRYWEKEFPQIVPKKGGRGVRQYTQAEIDKIAVVYNLVKVRGMKLAAAREALRRNKSGEVRTADVVERLRAVRAELQRLRMEIDALE